MSTAPKQFKHQRTTKIASILKGMRSSPHDHPYLEELGLHGAKCTHYEGPEIISGVPIDGSFTVKIVNIDQVVVNFLIKSRIANLSFEDILIPGGDLTGCFIPIGKMTDTILVANDYACAMALHLATGKCVAVALHNKNLLPVCVGLRLKYSDKKLVVCGGNHDNASKYENLEWVNQAAMKASALVAFPKGADTFLAMYRTAGPEMVSDLIDAASEPEVPFTLGAKNSKTISFDEPSFWSSRVNGNGIIAEIIELLNSHLSLPSGAAIAIALWVLFTHTIKVARVAPILAVLSPVRRCGKTTLVGLLLRLVHRPMASSNLTTAVLFRTVDQWSPTLLIDEADTFLSKSEELTGVINSGHTRHAAYVVRIGKDNKPERFDTFCPKLIAMIGKPTDTILDRSVVIHQQRKHKDDTKKKLSIETSVETVVLHARIARWAKDNLECIRTASCEATDLGDDRTDDNWEPLLAIAHAIGPECFANAIEAASLLADKHAKVSCTGEDLLKDIKTVFDHSQEKSIPTAILIGQLCADEESPWTAFKNGKPVTPPDLARLLKPFEIESENLRIGRDLVVKGYKHARFKDAFSRYVPTKGD